ncbi:glycosyltransferase family 2 protein [Flavobacterium sp. M31R6]|uniref:glycosyltransferase family 2 protein n=1 Tax=Flavobacterium sp. M31R6 TaxID=2739062 RepID=UPI001569DFB6|nr:glycosyltransferase family 2 protein [Flavobacterium sp. M31R6]QKJ64803.1 glycosyltransferase family 2 protein [Flavobacterium sp. M31R6]
MTLSVALCTYNGGKFLSEQLKSILSQSLSVDEIIICDDCSVDNTIELIHFYQDKYPGLIHLYQNKKSLGTIKNFEKAISITTGDLIFLADQDDVWHSNKVDIMQSFFENNKKCKLLFTDATLIDGEGIGLNSTLWGKWGFNEELRGLWKNNVLAFKDLIINKNKITGATICFHKSLKENILPIDLPYGYWHDAWFGIHASAIEGLMFIEDVLIDYRIHDDQQVGVSTVLSSEIVNKSNPRMINRFLFYKKIRLKYPSLKLYIPQKTRMSFLKKIKNSFIKLCHRI